MTQPRRPDPARSVAVVVPLHRLDEHGEPVIVRRPGRPRRVERAPTVDEGAYHAAVAVEAERAIERDGVVAAACGDNNPKAMLEATMLAVAEESASLRWERQKAVRAGKPDAERISSRRVQALIRLAELAIAREQLRRESGALEPEDVTRVVELLVVAVEETITDVAPAEMAATFMGSVRAKLATSPLANSGAS